MVQTVVGTPPLPVGCRSLPHISLPVFRLNKSPKQGVVLFEKLQVCSINCCQHEIGYVTNQSENYAFGGGHKYPKWDQSVAICCHHNPEGHRQDYRLPETSSLRLTQHLLLELKQ